MYKVFRGEKMGILDTWWKIQEDFQEQIFPNFRNLTLDEKISLTKEMLLHIASEFDELLSAVGTWKTHKIRKAEPPKISGITEELVDISKFLINIALIWEITPEQFIRKWFEKTVVNKYKLLQDKRLIALREKPVVVFDVDGVLNDFPERWVTYVNLRLGTNYTIKDYLEIPKHVPNEVYRRLKHEFYEEYSTSVEFTKEAKEVLSQLKKRGISVTLLTSRPISQYKKFYYEMIIKLKNSKIPFDVLIEDREKGLRIIKDFQNVLFAVDDEPYYVKDISSYGIRVFLYRKPYNSSFKWRDEIFSLEEVLESAG